MKGQRTKTGGDVVELASSFLCSHLKLSSSTASAAPLSQRGTNGRRLVDEEEGMASRRSSLAVRDKKRRRVSALESIARETTRDK
jgi:hypothetical protein